MPAQYPPSDDGSGPGGTGDISLPGKDRPPSVDPSSPAIPVNAAPSLRQAWPPGGVEDWVEEWTTRLRSGSHVPMSRTETKNFLRALAATIVSAMRGGSFRTGAIREVGARLVAAHFTDEEALATTQQLLVDRFAGAGDVPGGRLGAVVAALTAGYVGARTRAIVDQQETLHRAWVETYCGSDGLFGTVSRFESVFRHTAAGMCLVNEDNQIIAANPAFAALVGREAESCERLALVELVGTPDGGRVFAARRAASLPGSAPVELTVRCWHDLGHQIRVRMVMRRLGDQPAGQPGVVLVTANDVSREHDLEVLAERQSARDPLTYLRHRLDFRQLLTDALTAEGTGVALCAIGLTGFRELNEAFGQDIGDAVLCEAADRTQRTVGADGLVGRTGGTTFMAALTGTGGNAGIVGAQVAAALRDALTEPVRLGAADGDLRLRPVVITLPATSAADTADRLMTAAEVALRSAARSVRG